MSVIDTIFSVLMVGHSLFGQTGPDMLQEALRAGQGQGQVTSQIINGAPLRYNWDHSHEAEGIDAREKLLAGRTSHLILTEAIPLANHTQWSDTEVYAQAFFGLAVAANPQTHVYLQEGWHSLKSGPGAVIEHDEDAEIPWRQRLTRDLPVWEGIVAAVAAGNRVKEADISLIPAGQALGRLQDEIAAGQVPGLSDIGSVFSDDNHLNDLGHYFVAMVQYASLTGADPQGLPRSFKDRWGKAFVAPDATLARNLQRIAREAVQAYARQAGTPGSALHLPVKVAPAQQTRPPQTVNKEGRDSQASAIAVGLAPVSDWSVQQPFLDLMKTARPWVGHLPDQWGGMEFSELQAGGYLDARGWPTRMPPELGSIGTLVLTDMPEAAVSLAGRYVLRFEGSGVIEVSGRAKDVRYGAGEVRFDYAPGPGSVEIWIQRINVTDPPRNISVLREDRVALHAEGAQFNPDWTRRIAGFEALRFMDWMQTNGSGQQRWEDRPMPGDFTYAEKGVPVELLVSLANELGVDAWFNMPHLAEDEYIRSFAAYTEAHLDPGLKAYVEFSNEVWNWQFSQTSWTDAQALARWGEKDKGGQFYAMRAAEAAQIWSAVFDASAEARLVNVISTQTGWLGLEQDILRAPLWQAEGNPASATFFDAYAVSGYFGGVLGTEQRRAQVQTWLDQGRAAAENDAAARKLRGAQAAEYVEQHLYDQASENAAAELRDGALSGDPGDTLADLATRVWPYHAEVARDHGLQLIMYEGGSHVVGIGAAVEDAALTAFFHHLNYTPQMGALYGALLRHWQAVGGKLFTAYSDVYAPTKWGSWGGLRHLDDDNPRWDALLELQ